MTVPTQQQNDNSAQGNDNKAKADMPGNGDQATNPQAASNDDCKDGPRPSEDAQEPEQGGG